MIRVAAQQLLDAGCTGPSETSGEPPGGELSRERIKLAGRPLPESSDADTFGPARLQTLSATTKA